MASSSHNCQAKRSPSPEGFDTYAVTAANVQLASSGLAFASTVSSA